MRGVSLAFVLLSLSVLPAIAEEQGSRDRLQHCQNITLDVEGASAAARSFVGVFDGHVAEHHQVTLLISYAWDDFIVGAYAWSSEDLELRPSGPGCVTFSGLVTGSTLTTGIGEKITLELTIMENGQALSGARTLRSGEQLHIKLQRLPDSKPRHQHEPSSTDPYGRA